MGLIEICFFIDYHRTNGYSLNQIFIGMSASIAQITGTLLIIYASTYGLAGPSSAMVQSQGVVHVLLATIFLSQIPSRTDILGLCSAVLGAIIMATG